MTNLNLKIKDKFTSFELIHDLYQYINTSFKFEGKIQNDSKVISFTRKHTDDDADADGTKKQCLPLIRDRNLFL